MKKREKRQNRRKDNLFSFKEEYIKSWNYIKESRKFIYFMIILFFVSALIGFFIPAPEFIINKMLELIQELITKTEGLSQFELINFIFLSNLQSAFLGLVLGLFFGIFPVVVTIFNGYLLGFVSLIVINTEDVFGLWKLLPHGIFELTAVFITLGLGLKLGLFVFIEDKKKSMRDYLINSLRVFLLIVFPLLLLAAIVEGSLIALLG